MGLEIKGIIGHLCEIPDCVDTSDDQIWLVVPEEDQEKRWFWKRRRFLMLICDNFSYFWIESNLWSPSHFSLEALKRGAHAQHGQGQGLMHIFISHQIRNGALQLWRVDAFTSNDRMSLIFHQTFLLQVLCLLWIPKKLANVATFLELDPLRYKIRAF